MLAGYHSTLGSMSDICALRVEITYLLSLLLPIGKLRCIWIFRSSPPRDVLPKFMHTNIPIATCSAYSFFPPDYQTCLLNLNPYDNLRPHLFDFFSWRASHNLPRFADRQAATFRDFRVTVHPIKPGICSSPNVFSKKYQENIYIVSSVPKIHSVWWTKLTHFQSLSDP